MRRCLAPLVACSLFTVTACSTSQGVRTGSEQGQATAMTLTLCKVQRALFDDSASDDGRPTVGDSYTYTVNVSMATGPKACDEASGQFFGVEELVQELPVDAGVSKFLTNFQGTFVLPDGNLQLRSMGYVSVKAEEMPQMKRSGPVALGLGDLFPKQHEASVIGQGGAYTGQIGSAVVEPGNPPVVQLKLFKRF
jgi:hypothetical protein